MKQYTLTQFEDLQPLIKRLAQSKVVCLGEASHGTHEFYEWRAWITKELIQNHGFSFIAVESDWPEAYEMNKKIKGLAYEKRKASR